MLSGADLHHLVNTSAAWNVHVWSCSESNITDCQCLRRTHPVIWQLMEMSSSSSEQVPLGGAGKLDHQAYVYSVPIFQNSSWIGTCTHRCWIPLSMGNTQHAVLHKIRGGIQAEQWLQSVATVLWIITEYCNAVLWLGPIFVTLHWYWQQHHTVTSCLVAMSDSQVIHHSFSYILRLITATLRLRNQPISLNERRHIVKSAKLCATIWTTPKLNPLGMETLKGAGNELKAQTVTSRTDSQ